jgi:hypothetical protein
MEHGDDALRYRSSCADPVRESIGQCTGDVSRQLRHHDVGAIAATSEAHLVRVLPAIEGRCCGKAWEVYIRHLSSPVQER